jgi:hypothetical protein
LQAHFQEGVAPDEIEQVYHLKRAQPMLQAFTALFHGGQDGVLVRLLVLRELAADTATRRSRAPTSTPKFAYLIPESLETVLGRLRTPRPAGLGQSGRRLPHHAAGAQCAGRARHPAGAGQAGRRRGRDGLPAVAGGRRPGGRRRHRRAAQAPAGPPDRTARGIPRRHRLRFRIPPARLAGQVAHGLRLGREGLVILRAITSDERADSATHKAAQAIGRAQSRC